MSGTSTGTRYCSRVRFDLFSLSALALVASLSSISQATGCLRCTLSEMLLSGAKPSTNGSAAMHHALKPSLSKRLRRCLQRARARSAACRRLRVRDTASLSLPLRTRYMSLSDAQKRKLSKKDIKKLCKKASKSKSKCKKEKEHCTYKKKKCSPK
mmetsp:Transcript_21473/g.66576  ORF Transcript_21473/g.66576 Transcript_21473/m.66576 type:complete len:155 (-) Transcript_21473:1078-1542(-)